MTIANLFSKVAERGEYEDTHCKEEHKKTQLLTFSLVNGDEKCTIQISKLKFSLQMFQEQSQYAYQQDIFNL